MCAHEHLLDLLLDVLTLGPHLCVAVAPTILGGVAEVEFATRQITISPGVDRPQFRTALAHELVHLHRGPTAVGNEAREEQAVHEEVARLLVPRTHLPAILEATNPHRVAAELHVDLHTARLGIALAAADARSEGVA